MGIFQCHVSFQGCNPFFGSLVPMSRLSSPCNLGSKRCACLAQRLCMGVWIVILLPSLAPKGVSSKCWKVENSSQFQGCRFGPESSRQTLVSPICRSLSMICGGLFAKMFGGQIFRLCISNHLPSILLLLWTVDLLNTTTQGCLGWFFWGL